MTMRSSTWLLLLSTSALACSGRFEVGGMDSPTAGAAAGGTGNASGGTASASGGKYDPGAAAAGNVGFAGEAMAVGGSQMVQVGGSSAVGPGGPLDEFGPQCVPSGEPAPLAGAFAKPQLVWSRLQMVIWGKPAAPPGPLPAATTYAWASDLVDRGFADVTATLGAPLGARVFVSQWLSLGLGPAEEPGLLGRYDSLLARDVPALEVLLRTPLGETGRVGVFSEPKWLALHPTISSRGDAMVYNVFQQQVPPPPPNLENQTVDPSLPDRAALAQSLNQPVCSACHALMDPAGYALGHFGADAAYRELDHGQPIDTTGVISRGMDSGSIVMFDGIADFGAQLADRCEPTLSLADGFLRVALDLADFPQQQQQSLFEANQARMRQAYVAGGRSYAALVKAFAQSPAVLRP